MPFEVTGQISLPREFKQKLASIKAEFRDDATNKEPSWEQFFTYLLSFIEESPSS